MFISDFFNLVSNNLQFFYYFSRFFLMQWAYTKIANLTSYFFKFTICGFAIWGTSFADRPPLTVTNVFSSLFRYVFGLSPESDLRLLLSNNYGELSKNRCWQIYFWKEDILLWVQNIETREGWPLLTVETEVNGNSKRTYERGPSLDGSLGLSWQYKRLYSALTALVGPVQKIFFTGHYFNYFVPVAQQAGQAAVLGRLSLNLCPWFKMMLWHRWHAENEYDISW